MKRREFLGSAMGASVLAAVSATSSKAATDNARSSGREYYQLRRYQLSSAQAGGAADYFSNALVAALNRMQISPVGVFNASIGLTTPAPYLLMPCLSLETLAKVDENLMADTDYQKAARPFLTASAAQRSFVSMDTSLLQAFEKMPRLTLPEAAIARKPRIYEIRTYESPSERDHELKIEQMQAGESDIFKSVGAWPVFFADTLVGSRLPKLTYMLGYENLAARERVWAAFAAAPAWKALSTEPRYAFEGLVSNITNEILTPTPYSQI
ncbi:MAG TPA: NIPSNAP family protein [Rhizomicrobium sp.]|nr:NIPSNAP family protein [Rhizomicrobium sp.]